MSVHNLLFKYIIKFLVFTLQMNQRQRSYADPVFWMLKGEKTAPKRASLLQLFYYSETYLVCLFYLICFWNIKTLFGRFVSNILSQNLLICKGIKSSKIYVLFYKIISPDIYYLCTASTLNDWAHLMNYFIHYL
jgi:hypothetical protein